MSEQSVDKAKGKKGLIIGVIAALLVMIIGVATVLVLKKEVLSSATVAVRCIAVIKQLTPTKG